MNIFVIGCNESCQKESYRHNQRNTHSIKFNNLKQIYFDSMLIMGNFFNCMHGIRLYWEYYLKVNMDAANFRRFYVFAI